MSNNRDLLKEAIADAKAVKETAIANAKAALEEAFTPHLKSMLAAKLEEMDKDKDDEVKESEEIQETEDVVDEGYGKKDDKEKMDEAEEVAEAKEEIEEELDLDEMLAELDLSEKKEEEGKDKMEESEELDEAKEELDESEEIEESEEVEEAEEPVAEADEDEDKDEESEEEAEEGEEEEIDLEDMSADDLKGFIEDVIKDMVEAGELEAGEEMDMDMEMDDEAGDDLDIPMMEETEEVSESEEIEEAKEDLDEGIMDTLTKVFDKVTGIDKFNACQKSDWAGDECAKLKQEIGYAAGVKGGFEKGSGAVMEDDIVNALAEVEELKKELNEVNLLNAKLLYTNKIFRDKNLTEDKKVKVLKAFDKASTVKEAKVIFETLNEGLISKAKAPVNEVKGSASKVMGTAPTTKKPIVESNEMVNRFKKLAGII
jgi:hypothetical protein